MKDERLNSFDSDNHHHLPLDRKKIIKLQYMTRDTAIFDLIAKERERQVKGSELIASENFVSDQVLEAMGSVMTN